MLKTFAFAAALAAITTGSALAQSYDPDNGTGNVLSMQQVQPRSSYDQGLNARAEALDTRHHVRTQTFTNRDRALFNRISPWD